MTLHSHHKQPQAFDHAAWSFRNEQVWMTAFVCRWFHPVTFTKTGQETDWLFMSVMKFEVIFQLSHNRYNLD